MRQSLKRTPGLVTQRGISRGRLVLDGSTGALADPLSDLNIIVIVPPPHSLDKHRRLYVSGRILVTTRADRYVADATAYEYGLIAVSEAMNADPVKTATAISRAIVHHGLWSMGHSFLLDLGAGLLRDLWAEEQVAR